MKSPHNYREIYDNTYDYSTTERTLSGKFLQKSHALLEENLPKGFSAERILEVGSGTGNHFPFVKKTFSRYCLTDLSDEMLKNASDKYRQEISSGVLLLSKQDATNLTYEDNSFDRLIGTHVLEHLHDPVAVLKGWHRVVRPGGIISIVLPCDPGFLWRLGCHLGPRQNARKLGYDYDYMIASEHINTIFNLVAFIRYHFENRSESWYPAKVPVADLNLFYICHIAVN